MSSDDVVTSGSLAVERIASLNEVKAGHVVVAHGDYDVVLDQLRAKGVNAHALAEYFGADDPVYVCMSYTTEFGYDLAARLLSLAPRAAGLFATERDRWFGSTDGRLPGAGWAVSAAECLLDMTATVFGKPSPLALGQIARNFGLPAEDVLMVGDSLESDIRAAVNAGAQSCLYDPNRESRDTGGTLPDYVVGELADVVPLVMGNAIQ